MSAPLRLLARIARLVDRDVAAWIEAYARWRAGDASAERTRARMRRVEAAVGLVPKEEADYESRIAAVAEDLAEGRIDAAEAEVRRIAVRAAAGRLPAWKAELARARHEGRPWVGVVSSEYEPEEDDEMPGSIALELEWTPAFVEKLREAGYPGETDEEVVDAWFARTCALVAIESDPTLLEATQQSSVLRIERREAGSQIVFR